ncbi:MAG: winged helix-turn-helix domain-containing protein [Nitrosopumilus sp.]|jgi:predicted transcriptional regulator|nr:winged helix-turn-helix domain-containing protein [Nitrosopumilus sp.]
MLSLVIDNFTSNKKSNNSAQLPYKNDYDVTINLKVLIRMLRILRENNHINRTNLAGKTGLNYNTCIKYIKFLKLFCWANVTDDGTNFVFITKGGISFIETLSLF